MTSRIAVTFLISLAALASAVHAQTFPTKSLRIIVPFPPGGAADVTSRLLGEHMARGLGQSVIAENRPGAGAVIGYELAARAPGDGHTLLVMFPSFVINPAVKQGLKYDPLKDFKAVGQTISLSMAFAVNPSVPAKSIQELIALARAKPGEIAYGTPGAGTTHHVIGEMFRLAAKINIVHAPFQGEAPALTAAAGGHIPMVFVNASAVAPFAKSGKIRPLAVTTPERADVLPDVPTIREAGYPEIESTNWSGLVVPAATPPSAISRLNAELVRALRNAEVQEKLKAYGMSPAPGTPEQFGAFLQSEAARYAKAVREAGINAD
ncbi:MAG TPA: tripartite tricarboxylate transporter substrate binding protein [Burkholderiales bacterium]|nr:tripartite tricarboxylate transporter substrate binding protein [Burkholderiales bacterium]